VEINGNSITSWWLNHPFEKYDRQIGSSPQGFLGENKKDLSCHQLDDLLFVAFDGKHSTGSAESHHACIYTNRWLLLTFQTTELATKLTPEKQKKS